MKTYTVGVFTDDRGAGRKPLVMAYVRDYSPHWRNCCIHRVTALTGDGAKKVAIIEHKNRCLTEGTAR